MPEFSYTAKKEDGSTVAGMLQADNERSALDVLGRQGVFPMEIRRSGSASAARAPREQRPRRRIKSDDVGMVTQQLGDLLRAGVPINKALATLSAQTSNATLGDVMSEVGRDVSAGKTLSEALLRHPKVFPPLYVSLVKAGETGGFLEDVLHRLAAFIEKDSDLRSRVKAALAYPALLIVLGAGAIGFLMMFFIPRFSEIFRNMGSNLPLSTRLVMNASYFVRDYWMIPLAGVVLVAVGWDRLGASLAGRRSLDRLRLKLPLFGDITRKKAVARFTRTLGTLLKSGVPILTGLQIAREALGNVVLMADIDEASAGVRKGKGLAEILRQSGGFPVMVVDMIAVGEESGNLEEVLLNVADSYDTQVDRSVKVFISLFEPALLLFMASVIGFVVISMLLPVFTLSSMIGK